MMVDTAEQMGKKLMIGQNQRFAKAHAEAKKIIERGDIGSVLTFKTTFGHGGPETWSVDAGPQNWFFDKKRAAMGAMADFTKICITCRDCACVLLWRLWKCKRNKSMGCIFHDSCRKLPAFGL